MTDRDCVVAIDVGTSAVRAARIDVKTGERSIVRVPRSSSLGGDTFCAEALLDETEVALRDLEPGDGVAGLAISAHIGTVAVGVDCTPVEMGGGWADSRGLELLDGIDGHERERLLSTSGRPALVGGTLSLALELLRSGAADLVQNLLSPKDYLVAHLTGEFATDDINASYTLARNIENGGWNEELLDYLGIPRIWFPKQLRATEIVGSVTAVAAERTGLPVGTPVMAGGPDGSVGIGLMLTDTVSVIGDVSGTTDVIARKVATPERAPHGTVINPLVDGKGFTAGGATGLTGGAVSRWRQLVGAVDESEVDAVPPGSGGLSIVPSLSGHRYPRWRSADSGAVIGHRESHSSAHFIRAAQEGAAFTVREGLDLLDPSGKLPVVFGGGSARSEHNSQLRADCWDRTVHVVSDPDVSILGAAVIAMVGTGVCSSFGDARNILGLSFREISPGAGTEASQFAYERWLRHVELVAGE